ncbi:MAG TPA: hypothetical protein VK752_29585 [Bryobacteraceae bacterium]|jgi:uncharacterized protein (TIGR03437 family)|nr:hypothetical protein [Bryobacteraceae bacterium]
MSRTNNSWTLLTLGLGLLATSQTVAQAGVITAWTFENNAIALNNSPAPSTGSGTASSLGMATYATPNIGVTTDDVLAGSTGDTGVNGVADLTQVWRIRAQAGTAGAANGWSSAAPIGTQGAMFAASTVGYTNITVSFDWYATNQGEANLQFLYTTDGTTWHNAPLNLSGSDAGLALMNNTTSANTVKGSYVSITGGAGQGWFTGLTAIISDPNAANNPKFAVQMVNASTGADCIGASGTALNNNSGNWRFDNVAISGQSTFSGFTTGNLVLSRSVYMGDPSTVVVGEALPPVCPASANTAAAGACAGKATNNGLYPSTSSANNVWNNDTVDGSFGVTSPIFLDQLSPAGATLNSFAIPSNMIVTSFSSKSELGLNLSTDGSVITFMGYVAAPNTVDVSNSNTPGVYDPTNPSGGSYFRAVAQLGANGAIQVTPTNAYSGNNGRAAILANGQYYMVGNSNNGAATPTNVTTATGVEIATPGQAATTVPQEIGNFNITTVINPATGMNYTTADKAGKDNNFRGLTIFNNTLYVTKGSGSNGIDTVYQVGNAGTLPTLATAAAAPITVLPGFPTASAKTAGATSNYPFGIWFANSTTLYVADEGDGVVADAAGSTTAGLQKWVLTGGAWKMAYVLQNGLNLGQPYSIANYPTALNPATDGLRNITGVVNSNGTVTVYAITSTVSTNGDQGADPNKLVSITDTLANTTAASASAETFTTLRTAVAGEVLRGIAWAPSSTSMANAPLILSAASPSVTSIAQGGLAFAMGQNLAPEGSEILGPSPTSFDSTSVSIEDAKGNITSAPLIFVSPNQVTFQVPSTVAAGMASVTVTAPGSSQTASNVVIAPVAPAVFTVNGNGLVAGYATRISAAGTQIVEPAYSVNAQGSFSAAPINMGSATDKVYLAIYATGVQAAGIANVTVTVNGVNTPVLYAGNAGYAGVDQVNVLLPATLAGSGTVALQITASGIAANTVQVAIQ